MGRVVHSLIRTRSTREERTYVICVDSSDNTVRSEINSRILRVGVRLQFSVFIVAASPVIFAELHRDIKHLCTGSATHVVVVDLGPSTTVLHRVTEIGFPVCGEGDKTPVVWKTPNGWFA